METPEAGEILIRVLLFLLGLGLGAGLTQTFGSGDKEDK